MNKNLLVVFLIVAVLVVGYMISSKKTTTSQTPEGNEVVVTLSEQNSSGEYGTAALVEENGQLTVTLDLVGAPSGVTQPAHIHTGPCADIGGVTYALEFPVGGNSVTTLDVTLDQLATQMPLALNVHKSVSEAGVYVSCGDLSL